MDWSRVVLAGLMGGLFGGVGAALAMGLNRLRGDATPESRQRTVLIVSVTAALFGAQTGRLDAMKALLHPPSRFERAARAMGTRFAAVPGLREHLAGLSPEQAHARGQELARLGMKRLDAEALVTWNRLRLGLANASPALCAGFWSGRIDPQVLQQSLDGLSDEDVDAWLTVSFEATKREFTASAPLELPADALEKGLLLVHDRLSEAERPGFIAALEAGERLGDAPACAVMKQILTVARGLPEAQREQVLRALAAL